MQLFRRKTLECGFVILCPDHATGLLRSTANSVKVRYPLSPVVCAADDTSTAADLKEMRRHCPTVRGGSSFSSLLNAGMAAADRRWNFVMVAGATMRDRMDERFGVFVESERDVLYPIADRKSNFVDATLNGLCIHKSTWDAVGPMAEVGPFEVVKLMWALDAVDHGVKFKAIANCKIC